METATLYPNNSACEPIKNHLEIIRESYEDHPLSSNKAASKLSMVNIVANKVSPLMPPLTNRSQSFMHLSQLELDQSHLKGKLLRRRDAVSGEESVYEETKNSVKLISSQPMIVDEI